MFVNKEGSQGAPDAVQNSVCLFDALQLDCPSVRHWDVVTTFAVEVRFQIRDQFWIPQPKLHGACYLRFFNKTSTRTGFLRFLLVFLLNLVPKSGFQVFLGTVSALWAQN